MKRSLSAILLFPALFGYSQHNRQAYIDSLTDYRKNYIQTHEIVRESDRQFFRFYPIDPAYHIAAKFERISNDKWFPMNTSGKEKQVYRRFGKITFKIHDTAVHLYIYQSQSLLTNQQYKDYLFIPFTDATSGLESYGGGRYLDFTIADITNNSLLIDFNKAYNPYCAYTTGYNCPIPPKENDLPVAIRAGEKNYCKPNH